MMPQRAKFEAQCAHLFAARRAARLAALEAAASIRIQARVRGWARRSEYRATVAALAQLEARYLVITPARKAR